MNLEDILENGSNILRHLERPYVCSNSRTKVKYEYDYEEMSSFDEIRLLLHVSVMIRELRRGCDMVLILVLIFPNRKLLTTYLKPQAGWN